MKRYLLLLLSLVLPLHAERLARITYFNAPAETFKEFLVLQEGSEPQRVEVYRKNFSPSITIESKTTRLFLAPVDIDLEKVDYEDLPSVKLNSRWTKTLIFLSLDQKNALLPVKAYTADASDSAFGPGSMMILNFTSYQIAGTVGKKKVRLTPKNRVVLTDLLPKSGSCSISLDMRAPEEERVIKLMRKAWPYSVKSRMVLFITKGEKDPYPKYQATTLRSF